MSDAASSGNDELRSAASWGDIDARSVPRLGPSIDARSALRLGMSELRSLSRVLLSLSDPSSVPTSALAAVAVLASAAAFALC
jgi:hypothetical protein